MHKVKALYKRFFRTRLDVNESLVSQHILGSLHKRQHVDAQTGTKSSHDCAFLMETRSAVRRRAKCLSSVQVADEWTSTKRRIKIPCLFYCSIRRLDVSDVICSLRTILNKTRRSDDVRNRFRYTCCALVSFSVYVNVYYSPQTSENSNQLISLSYLFFTYITPPHV